MVTDPGDYRWSSYRTHAFGDRPKLWSPHELYTSLRQQRVDSRYGEVPKAVRAPYRRSGITIGGNLLRHFPPTP